MSFKEFLEADQKDIHLRQQANQIGSGLGWKIHLTTGMNDAERESAVKQLEWIRTTSKIPFKFKVLSGGEAGDKDITIYVGPKRVAIQVANWIKSNYELRKILKSPGKDVSMDDIEIVPGIWARFDSAVYDDRFSKYGAKGWDLLFDDKEQMVNGKMLTKFGQQNTFNIEDARKRAFDALKRIYGDVFTG